jgi:hypothetical protein
MSEHHTILGGKVHVYKRPNSSSWQCATYLAGKNRHTTTKEESLSKAKEFAEDWYLQLRAVSPATVSCRVANHFARLPSCIFASSTS